MGSAARARKGGRKSWNWESRKRKSQGVGHGHQRLLLAIPIFLFLAPLLLDAPGFRFPLSGFRFQLFACASQATYAGLVDVAVSSRVRQLSCHPSVIHVYSIKTI